MRVLFRNHPAPSLRGVYQPKQSSQTTRRISGLDCFATLAMTLIGLFVVCVLSSSSFAEVSLDFAAVKTKAEQGDARAQYDLGLMYAKGHGVPKDDVEAIKWFRKAAEQGNANAQLGLGLMYELGQGVPRDYVTAYMWVSLAAAQGNEMAIENHNHYETQLTDEQKIKALKMVLDLKEKPNTGENQ